METPKIVFLLLNGTLHEAIKWRYAVRKAKIRRYAVRKGEVVTLTRETNKITTTDVPSAFKL